jgi:hypothetical protein
MPFGVMHYGRTNKNSMMIWQGEVLARLLSAEGVKGSFSILDRSTLPSQRDDTITFQLREWHKELI